MLPPDNAQDADLPVLAMEVSAGPGRGAGHLARCLALGQAWVRSGGRCVVVADALPEPWAGRYAAAGVAQVAAGSLDAADWWLVDGYDLADAGRPAGARLARIDDHGLSPVAGPEVLVDQNLGASAAAYPGVTGDLFLGTRYALLRREMVEAATAKLAIAVSGPSGGGLAATRVLVVLGGAPSPEVLQWADDAAAMLDAPDVVVEFLRGDADPVPALAAADVALAASGSVVWELCLFQVPCVLVAVAPNQEPLGAALSARGAADYLGVIDEVPPAAAAAAVTALVGSPAARAGQIGAMAGLVDGRGAGRVAARLRSALVMLRPAGPGDVDTVYELNNHPTTRAASFHSEAIARPDHDAWFDARLGDPATRMYLATDGAGRLLGLVRFTIGEAPGDQGRGAEIGVVVAPDRRGQGWAAALIDAGVRSVFADADAGVATVLARVKADNPASSAAFLAADFDALAPEADGVLRYARSHVRPAHA